MKNILAIAFIVCLLACRKERVTTNPDARLTTSTDTVRFDTVFTTTGSITQTIKLFNTNKEGIRITSLRLTGGAASAFQINANGTPGPAIENLELAGNDSAYVFVSVTIPATAATTTFIVQDSIEVVYNGNKKWIQLEAFGRNAHFLRNHTITGTEVWNADKPYVLLGKLLIEKDAHLTINEGCAIYAHANAPMVVEGQLTVHGDKWDSTKVIFTGDRLDKPYNELPGSWPGILFTESSHDNLLQHAVLKNAYQAIVVEPSSIPNKLRINETIITNASDAGILASNASITAQNLLIRNCGKGMVLQDGGTYNFTHATVAGFSTLYLPHKNPVLAISNAAETTTHDLNAVFRNCIFWGLSGGAVPEEIVVLKKDNGVFNVQFDGVLWPVTRIPEGASVTTEPLTSDPEFDSVDAENKIYDFHLKQTSPARTSGVPTSVSLDLDGNPRPALNPDLGAYQKQ